MKSLPPASSVFRICAAVGLCFQLGGCASSNPPRTTAERPIPSMPTVGPQTKVAQPKVSEEEIVATALRAALNDDVPGALRTLQLADESGERAAASTKLVRALADQNPTTAANVALGLPASPTRSSAIETAALAWTQRDADAALRWSVGLTDAASAHAARRAVIGALVRANPRAALDRIAALPANPSRDEAMSIAAAIWVRQDFDSATAWLRLQPDSTYRQRLASSMAFETAQVSPPNAITLSEMLPPGRDRWIVFSEIGQTWIAIDRNAAVNWAYRLQEPEAREAALAGINSGSGVASTRRAPNFPNPNSGVRSRGFRTPNALESPMDPPEFTLWLALQPQPMSRDEAILEFVRQRGALDVGSIGYWLANLTPTESSRQRALEIYFDTTLRGSPASAANWLRSLPSSDRRDEMVEKIVREWKITDPNAAATWVREMNLPAFRQEELLRR